MIPLSTRMRPQNMEEFIGQSHFIYLNSLFFNAVKNKNFDSAIFYGPSGTGKTTLARIIAKEMDSDFHELNASTAGTKELKEIIDNAKNRYFGFQKETTYVYVDEFHRWNKLQQDSLLKALEDGVIKFIGSTTENPYFSVNNAIISRVGNIYEFKRHSAEDIYNILKNALNDEIRGLGSLKLDYDEKAIETIAYMSNGDARIALDTLGFIGENIKKGDSIKKETVSEAMQRQTTFYDKSEDKYNLLSALQKSIRGSDPDASIHYLSRLIEGGADLQMISRRLLVIASEDIGLAYPNAIVIVNACVQAALMVGFPEAYLNLSEAVILLASSPKSNACCLAIKEAIYDVEKLKIDDIPNHLKDSHYLGAAKRGIGIGYKYPHDYGGYIKQQYLPDNLFREQKIYYKPTDNGNETAFKKYLEGLKKKND